MPDYKLKSGDIVFVAPADVDSFLENNEGAALIENKVEVPKKEIDPVVVDQAAGLKKITDSDLEDGSLVPASSQQAEDFRRLSSTLRGEVSRSDVFADQINIEQEAFSKIGITPDDLQALAVKRQEFKQEKVKLRKDLTEETKDIFQEFNNNLPTTDIGTIDYDNKLAIEESRSKLQNKFINNNKYIQKTIVPNVKKDLQPVLDEYILKAKAKYDLNDPKNVTQDNIDSFYKDINSFYGKAINAKVSANSQFKNIVKTFDGIVDEKLSLGVNNFIKGKDSPNLYKVQQFLDSSPLGITRFGGEALEKLTTSWNSLRGVNNQMVKAGVFGNIAEVTDAIVSFEKNNEIAKAKNWSNEVVGYWRKEGSKPMRFQPKFNKDTGNNNGEGTTFNDGVSTEGTWGDFKTQFGEYQVAKDNQATKNLVEIQSKDFVLNSYDKNSFSKVFDGEDMGIGTLDAVTDLGFEQIPQMALSIVTLGASSGLQIGGGIFADGVSNEARKRFGEEIAIDNKENKQSENFISLKFLREVSKDEKFMKTLAAKSVAGGFVAGQLDKFGASKALSTFTIKGTQSLLRGGYKSFIKGVANGTLKNQKNAAIESVTESLQEVIQAGSAGSEIKSGDLAQAAGTAYVTTSFFGIAGKVKSQSAVEIRSAAKMIAGKLNPNSSEAIFNTKIEEINNLIDEEIKTGGRDSDTTKSLVEKRNSVKEIRDANKTLPNNYSVENKSKALDLILERDRIAKEIEGKDDALIESEKQEIKDINSELKEVALNNLSERAVAKGKKIAGKVRKSVDKISEQLGVNLQRFSEKDGVSAKDQIEAKKKELLADKYELKKSLSYGESFVDKDGNDVVLIDEELALKDNVYTTEQHEVLHPLLKQTFINNKEASFSLGTALLNELGNSENVTIKNPEVQARVLQYLEEGISASTTMEEVMNFTSEALSKNFIEVNSTASSKIADIFRRLLRSAGVNIKFNKGSDVLNFIRDYNKTIESGGKLSKGLRNLNKEGARGKLSTQGVETLADLDDGYGGVVKEAVDKAVDNKQGLEETTKESKQLTPEQDTQLRSDVAEIKKLAAENEALAKKYKKYKKDNKGNILKDKKGNPVLDIALQPKQTRLENKVKKEIKPIVDRIVTDRTKALYDPIADEAKKTVSRQDFQESMRSDIEIMVFNEFEDKQDLEKFIVNRAFLRANNLAKRLGIQSVEDGITKGLEAAEKVAVDETVAIKDKDVKLTKATKILSKDQLIKAKDKIAKMDIDPKNISYKKLGTVTADVTAEVIGIPASKITDAAKNLSKPETTTAAMFIEKNVDYIRRTLPEGAVLQAATEKLLGTSTGVPRAMLNAFYTKGKRSSKGAGLIPWNKNKDITNNDILEAIGRQKDQTPVPIDPRSPQGQMIKGIVSIVDRNITNELVRTDKNLSIEQEVDAGAGKSNTMFSLKASPELIAQIQELSQLRDIKSVAKDIGHPYKSPKENNRFELQGTVLRDIEEYGLDSNAFLAMSPASGGAVNQRRSNGDVYYKLTNGEYIKGIDTGNKNIVGKKMFKQPIAPKGTSLVAPTGRLYYGTTDPAYKTALEAARKNDNKSSLTKAVKLGMPAKDMAIDKKWIENRKAKSDNNMNVLDSVVNQLADAVAAGMPMETVVLIVAQGYQATSGLIKIAAPFKYVSIDFEHGVGKNSLGKKYREEHNPPASVVGASILAAIKGNAVKPVMAAIRANYHQTQLSKKDDSKLDMAKLDATMPEGTTIFDNPVIRLVKAGIDLNSIIDPVTGKSLAQANNVGISNEIYNSFNKNEKLIIADYQNKILEDYLVNPDLDVKNLIKEYLKLVPSKANASISNNNISPAIIKYSIPISVQQSIDMLAKTDKALDNARKINAPIKKIRVFDFDDTLARTKSNVLYTMPGEIKMFHGGNIKSVKDINGFVYFSEDQKQAAEYAKGNEGDVNSFAIKESEIASEDVVYSEIERLGLKPKGDFNADELNLYELIDPSFDTSLSEADLTKLSKGLKSRGVKAVRFTDMNLTSLKNDIENIVVIDKSIIKEQRKLTAAEFATRSNEMAAEGVEFDFSEFSKVMDGKEGPLFEVAKKIQEVRGSEDIFVLTARPANAAGPIQEFLKSLGLDIPLKNITGLGDGSPQAKAGWIVGKAADGYNDFYFTDDAIGNVKAVKKALSVLDVKSKVQQAKIKNSLLLDKEFNKILENKTGIAAEKNYAKVKAALVGKSKGRLNFFIAPSAEDFVGLLYSTLGKGKLGDTQMNWYKDNLLNPYARAMANITKDRNVLGSNFKALKKELGIIPKDLKKKLPGEIFSKEQAVRVYIWSQTGQEVPGLSKSDLKELTDMVKNDPKLELFAQEIIKLNKGREYAKPSEAWTAGTITTDILGSLNTTGRKKYLEQWQQNVDIIFSEKNLNKLEAAYGKNYRVSMENILGRMETGRNKSYGSDSLAGRFTDWINGSTAGIMFLNIRSAALQTLSAFNFINFGDNNIFAAGKAFANQSQYWKDFKTLYNSDFLTERRGDLKININEADIADAAQENGAKGAISKLLKFGFKPTVAVDGFAIASGGAAFYRNRIKALIKGGMDPVAAEKQAMRDFRETAEESQQSSRADKISSQQAGELGRIVLAFANTPSQYARLMKKAARDLKNGRGSTKANISKILYYGFVQNFAFNALQNALFAISFGDDMSEDEEEELGKKQFKIINGMVDSVARGTGVRGAIFTVVKNAGIKLYNETQKNNPKYEDVALELLKISPPISSKVGKMRTAGRTFSWNMEEINEKGFALDNPAYLAAGNVVSAVANVPLDRLIKKVNNLVSASNSELEAYKRAALVLGWNDWELNINAEDYEATGEDNDGFLQGNEDDGFLEDGDFLK